jgi:transcriptional activator for dhaKLM operon
MRLGSARPIAVDVRIQATTTADVEERVKDGTFIPHLYYRFGVFNIFVPPLRERVEDIPLLAERFLARITTHGAQDVWIDDEAAAILRRYPWPGNVRELESVLERAINHSRDGVIRLDDLPQVVRQGRILSGDGPRPKPLLSVAEAEREAILRAGWACRGRVGEMARQLGIGRTTLWRKMKRYHLTPDLFKM